MRILAENKVIPDNEVIFFDGFLYIISIIYGDKDITECDRICLNAEYDEPMSLADIVADYPNVHKVIFEDAKTGYVYNYGNHKGHSDEMWEQVGTTLGYY